jgi:predicted RNA-binding protein (virulence factor B family)
MINIGQMNRLRVIKQVDFGLFLDGDKYGNILLPKRYVPASAKIGDELDVFIYLDSDDCIIATTLTPKVMVGQCAHLEVKEVNAVGAFLDWGLPKDLLVPYNEQLKPMEAGNSYVVCVYLDPHSSRITASSRLSHHLEERASDLKLQQQVDLIICGRTELGFKAVINHTHLGLVFRDNAPRTLLYGEKLKGFIKEIRPDRKIGLSLQPVNSVVRDQLTDIILDHLKANGGESPLTDKSEPEEIYFQYKVSKGIYKNALSKLYKERKILITKEKVTLV